MTKEEKIYKEEMDFIKKSLIEGPEWSPIKKYEEHFYNEETQKMLVLHELGHALFAFKQNNFRTMYLGFIKGKLNFGVVFQKRKFKKAIDNHCFRFGGLLASFAKDDKIKNVLVAIYDLCPFDDALGFKNFQKAITKYVSFLKKHETIMLKMRDEIYRDCLESKERVFRIDENKFEEYLK